MLFPPFFASRAITKVNTQPYFFLKKRLLIQQVCQITLPYFKIKDHFAIICLCIFNFSFSRRLEKKNWSRNPSWRQQFLIYLSLISCNVALLHNWRFSFSFGKSKKAWAAGLSGLRREIAQTKKIITFLLLISFVLISILRN